MKNPLTLWKKNREIQRLQDVKSRLLKNEEVVLEAMGKRAKGAKTCEHYLGATCVADACSRFNEWETLPDVNGKKRKYSICDYSQAVRLQLDLLNEQRRTNQLLSMLVGVFQQTAKEEK